MIKYTKKAFLSIACAMAITAVSSLGGCSAHEINAGMGIATNLLKGATVTNQQLAQSARKSVMAMDKKYGVAAASSKYSRRLHRLTHNLQHYDGMNLQFAAYQSGKVNAYAMPDGSVRVFSGLMDLMNDDELLAVIGHEMGHVRMQHSLGQYRKAYLAKAAQAGLVAYGGRQVANLAGTYGDIGLSALSAQFSQRDELEADTYSVRFLRALGRNPYAAVEAQRKLMALGQGGGGFFSTHPSSQKRIQNITAAAQRLSRK